jgi:DNA-binding FadR family transcriptional regulator
LKAHVRIIEAIESGDAVDARRLVAQHLAESQTYVLSESANQHITVATPYLGPF